MDINIDRYKVKQDENIRLKDFQTSEDKKKDNDYYKNEIIPGMVKELKNLHLKLHAEEKNGILVVLQALDAAGKDEAISYIFSNLNAQGLKTYSFKKPSDEEEKHDYMWRLHHGLPARGEISILNRSYYEEVIVTRVHDLLDEKHIPDEADDEQIWDIRYRQIKNYEHYLHENGFLVVKFFFNMSKKEQGERLLERMKNPEKNWEFSFNDVKEREYWDQYQEVFEDMLNKTSTEECPWYVLPADDEWYSRTVLTEIMNELLREINPQFPTIDGEEKEKLDEYIQKLEEEQKEK